MKNLKPTDVVFAVSGHTENISRSESLLFVKSIMQCF